MLDALHPNQATLRQIHQDNGADYLLPVKENHEGLAARVAQCMAAPPPIDPGAPESAAPANLVEVGIFPLGSSRSHQSSVPAVRFRRRARTQSSFAARKAFDTLDDDYAGESLLRGSALRDRNDA